MLLKWDLFFQSFLIAKQFKKNNPAKITFDINVALIFSDQIMLLPQSKHVTTTFDLCSSGLLPKY